MLRKMLLERERARVIDRLALLDPAVEPNLDQFAERAATAFSAPLAAVTLLRDRRLWIRAGVGLPLECIPRDTSFCTRALDRGGVTEVCDAPADPRFHDLPTVTGEPYVRYYIGAPLRLADETDVGMLCVVDIRPRPPASPDQRACLLSLARQATYVIERHGRIGGSGRR